MAIELAQLRDGHLALLANEDFPDKIGSVEFFRYERKLQLSYENADLGGWLIGRKLPDHAITALESSFEEILVIHVSGRETEEYFVPLQRIID